MGVYFLFLGPGPSNTATHARNLSPIYATGNMERENTRKLQLQRKAPHGPNPSQDEEEKKKECADGA